MMYRFTRPALILSLAFSGYAAAQATPAPEPAPPAATTPALEPSPTPDAPIAEAGDIEIIGPPAAPAPRAPVAREIRLLRTPGRDEAIWIDGDGVAHELSDSMRRALEFNPDIRALHAEIEALTARLRAIESKTAADVVRKRAEMDQLVQQREKDKRLVEKKFKTPADLVPLDAEIEAKKVELMYLTGDSSDSIPGTLLNDRVRIIKRLGRPGDGPALAPLVAWGNEARPSLESATPESVKRALAAYIQIKFDDTSPTEIAAFIKKLYKVNVNVDAILRNMAITVDVENVTLEQALRAMAEASDLALIIRDYGIFVTTPERALSIPGPSIPEGVPYRKSGPRRIVIDRDEQSDTILDIVEGNRDAPKVPAAEAPKDPNP